MVNDAQKRYADDVTLQELVRLRVENDRMKEALLKIKNLSSEGHIKACAHSALKEKQK
jgi:hypothetical protein